MCLRTSRVYSSKNLRIRKATSSCEQSIASISLRRMAGKRKVQKINMGLPQIIYQCWNGNISVTASIHPGKPSDIKLTTIRKVLTVYSVKLTNFFHRFVTKSQRKSETTHHLQQRIVITDKINHLIGWFIFL